MSKPKKTAIVHAEQLEKLVNDALQKEAGDDYPEWIVNMAAGVEGHYNPMDYDAAWGDVHDGPFYAGLRTAQRLRQNPTHHVFWVMVDDCKWFFVGESEVAICTQITMHRVMGGSE